MPLVDDLLANATAKIAFFNTNAGSRRTMIGVLRDITLLQPNGLRAFTMNSEWLQDFALVIKAKQNELLPYVTTYSAAFGMLAVFNRILLTWVTTPDPTDPDIPQAHKDQGAVDVAYVLDNAIREYVRTIVKD